MKTLSTDNKISISIILAMFILFAFIGLSSYEYDHDLYHGIPIEEKQEIIKVLQANHIPASQENILWEYKNKHPEFLQE